MNPAKSLLAVFYWMLRIAILFVVYTRFFDILEVFNTSTVIFYIAAAYILFTLLLFLGGFFRKHTLTIISGLFIAGLSVYQMIQIGFPPPTNGLSFYFLLTVCGLIFVGTGNKK